MSFKKALAIGEGFFIVRFHRNVVLKMGQYGQYMGQNGHFIDFF